MSKHNNEQEVQVEIGSNCGRESKKYTHPAFGLIKRNVYTGKRNTFGSPLETDEFFSITVTKATHECTRTSEMHHPEEEMLSVILTASQWANFITTSNSGVGTPCTLRHVRQGDLESVPEISNPRYNSTDYYEQVKDIAKKTTERLKQLNAELMAEINGKASKVRLREIQRQIDVELSNMPSNMAFTIQVAEEKMIQVADEITMVAQSKIANYANEQGLGQIDVAELKQINHKGQ